MNNKLEEAKMKKEKTLEEKIKTHDSRNIQSEISIPDHFLVTGTPEI